jgi:hypothetical protein
MLLGSEIIAGNASSITNNVQFCLPLLSYFCFDGASFISRHSILVDEQLFAAAHAMAKASSPWISLPYYSP